MSATTDLRVKIEACTNCELCDVGTGPVPFRGRPSTMLILGEAPGQREDDLGKPFVGPAGVLLWQQLAKVGIARSDVMAANTVSCWPGSQKTPTQAQICACRGNFIDQIKLCDPTIILALGKTVNWALQPRQRQKDVFISKIRGKWFVFPFFQNSHGEQIYVMPTFHPAAVLRNSMLTRAFRADLRAFSNMAHGPKK